MNHLGKRTNVAKALYRGLISEVFDHGRIETTLAKAKAVSGEIDKLINFAKQGTVNARRLTIKTLATDRYFDKLSKTFQDRKSGYTRIIRLGQRLSDASEMVIFELVEKIAEPVKEVAKTVEEPVKPEKVKAEKKVIKKVKKATK
ncbi:50S ribosomal protein L17 [Candidatus Microgenomates bacterium]|nr:50S ribosomal protein L17 [Candidatus Microgenomates bacterium]